MKSVNWILFCLLLLPVCPTVAQTSPEDSSVSAAGSPENKLISLDLRDASVRRAIEDIFKSVQLECIIDANVDGFVTLKVVNQPFEIALKLLMRSASIPLTYTKENGVYRIFPRPGGIGAPEKRPFPPLTLDLREASLRQTLEQIFRSSQQNFVIAPEVSGFVTVKIRNASLPVALNLLIRASGQPLKWRIEKGVYFIEPVSARPHTQQAPPPEPSRAFSQGALPEVIPVVNLTAAELIRQLAPIRPDGIDNLLVQNGTNSLLAFSSDADAIRLLKERIKFLDVASAPVVLRAEVVRIDAKEVRTVLFAATVQGRSGSTVTVSDSVLGNAVQAGNIKILLTPTILGDGVETTNSWELSLALAGAKGSVVRLEKAVSATTRLLPGKTTLVSETKRNQNGLKERLLLLLTWESARVNP
jgi:type II secretory pathway component GspD/PulD (secretin)